MPTQEITVAEILMTPPAYYFLAALAFIFGLLVGSFLNVVIYRLPMGLSTLKPKRSFCFRCGTKINGYDNIPVISYFILRGRCRACGQPFSPRYALIEFLTGTIFLGMWFTYTTPVASGFTPLIFWYFVFASCLIVGTFTDFDHWIIPPSVPRLGAVLAIVAALAAGYFNRGSLIAHAGPFPALRLEKDTFDRILGVMMGPSYINWRAPEILWWEPLVNSLIGAFFAPFLVYAVGWFGKIMFRKEAMGFGDVELFVMIGAALGPVNSVLVLVLASFFGSIAGGIGILMSRAKLDRSPLRLGEINLREYTAAQAEKSAAPSNSIPSPDPEEESRAREFASSMDMPFVDLRTMTPSSEALAAIPAEVACRLQVLPLETGEKLRMAVEDPLSTKLITELYSITDLEMDFLIAAPTQLRAACAHYYSNEPAPEPVAEEPPAEPLWQQYYEVASHLEQRAPSHHLPFIPWITLAAMCVAIFQPIMIWFLNRLFIVT